jgi:hypothetical protein
MVSLSSSHTLFFLEKVISPNMSKIALFGKRTQGILGVNKHQRYN